MSSSSSSSLSALLEALRENLRRWGELFAPAKEAQRKIRPVLERGRRLEFDISVDPGSAAERIAGVKADLGTIQRRFPRSRNSPWFSPFSDTHLRELKG
jgi:hypothetical protein